MGCFINKWLAKVGANPNLIMNANNVPPGLPAVNEIMEDEDTPVEEPK